MNNHPEQQNNTERNNNSPAEKNADAQAERNMNGQAPGNMNGPAGANPNGQAPGNMNGPAGANPNSPAGANPNRPRYQHQNWQESPRRQWTPPQANPGGPAAQRPPQGPPQNPLQGPGPVPGPGAGPNRGPQPPYGMPRPRKKKTAVLPVLIAVLLTFVLTGSMTWGLAAFGVLPGTARASAGSVPEGTEAGKFGLSIHTDDPEAQLAAEKLGKVLNTLSDNYYRVLSSSELLEAMTEGVVNSMESKYTYYLNADEYKSFLDSMNGNYSGIGATVRRLDDGRYQIVSTVKDGPAAKAGLLAGDFIVKVDGKDTSEYPTASQLAADVKGEDGTSVKLTIFRDSKEMDISVVRAQVTVEHVQTRMLDDKTGYLYVSDFSDNLPQQFKAGLEKLKEEGALRIVFDMRGNPGGSADALIKCLDMLLPECTIATIRGRQDGEAMQKVWKAEEGTLLPEDMPFAILVNGGTASAAELFSGCLRDYQRAVLIGSKTYGKGSGMNTWALSDGSAITITTFNYYLPNGDMIEGDGLEPYIKTDGVDPEYAAIPQYELTPEQDPDLQAALDYFENAGVTSARLR